MGRGGAVHLGPESASSMVFTILEPEKEKKGGGGFRKWKRDVK